MQILSAANQTSLIIMKRPSVFPVAALFVLLAFSGCAGKDIGVWEQDKPLVLESIQQTQSDYTDIESRLERMENQIFNLEKRLKNYEAKNSALTASVRMLRKQSSTKKKTEKVTGKDQKLVRKLQKIESSIRAAATKGTPVIQPTDKNIEKNKYTAAYLALKSGRYEEASSGFQSLLKAHPQGEFTDQAYFWLGESYFAQQKMKDAIIAFKKVADGYPDSAKHPAALLKLADAYQESGHKSDAKKVLQLLIKQHPESNAAERARTKLKTIEAERNK